MGTDVDLTAALGEDILRLDMSGCGCCTLGAAGLGPSLGLMITRFSLTMGSGVGRGIMGVGIGGFGDVGDRNVVVGTVAGPDVVLLLVFLEVFCSSGSALLGPARC